MNKTMGAFLNVTPAQLEDPSKGFANVLGIHFKLECLVGLL